MFRASQFTGDINILSGRPTEARGEEDLATQRPPPPHAARLELRPQTRS